ncbi:peptidase m12a domain containing protein [Lasius niger]|uniref:Peptidase m12a domain containing protein n=1 Tax=Lasius niger TaxID=67767 RepID=A0A0J7MMH1_LASNI|nr:peptidase m12a domain containing protein [Lasius niger]
MVSWVVLGAVGEEGTTTREKMVIDGMENQLRDGRIFYLFDFVIGGEYNGRGKDERMIINDKGCRGIKIGYDTFIFSKVAKRFEE